MQITINSKVCRSLAEVQLAAPPRVAEFIAEFCDDKPYVMAHTSGSTGAPTPIRLLKSDMAASAKFTNEFFGLTSESLLYLGLSTDYIAGKMMIVRALTLGASIITEEPTNRPLCNYAGEQISLAAFVPSQIAHLLSMPQTLAKIDKMIIGGGKLMMRWQEELAQRGVKAFMTYGMTETCSHVALAEVAAKPQPYTALGDISFSTDNNSCLIIEVPHFANSHYETRDVVQLIDSRHFYWRSRLDNVINSGGVKVYPEEIEPKLTTVFDGNRFYITSAASEKWGEEVVLAIEDAAHGSDEPVLTDIPEDLLQRMKAVLPCYFVPKRCVVLKQFAMTASGKIIRKSF